MENNFRIFIFYILFFGRTKLSSINFREQWLSMMESITNEPILLEEWKSDDKL